MAVPDLPGSGCPADGYFTAVCQPVRARPGDEELIQAEMAGLLIKRKNLGIPPKFKPDFCQTIQNTKIKRKNRQNSIAILST